MTSYYRPILINILLLKLSRFLLLPLELKHFILFWAWKLGKMIPWYQKALFFIGFQIRSHGVSNSITTIVLSNTWFPISLQFFNPIFLITTSNFSCSSLWKLTSSSTSIFGSFSPSWPPNDQLACFLVAIFLPISFSYSL